MAETAEKRSNFCKPYMKLWGKINDKSSTWLFKPLTKCCNCDDNTCCLWFWGCCWCVLPVCTAWVIIALSILLVINIILCGIGLILGFCGVLVGIWPAFIITFGVTGATIIRLPYNLFYTFKVTYRTVCIRTGLRVISFVVLPILHLLFPIFTFVIVGVCSLVVCISISFCGDCLKPWDKMPQVFQKFWKIYVTDAKKFANDYGHPSGVPVDWDGRVYGIPLDPLTVVCGILLFIYGIVACTIGNFLLFTIKGIPIYFFAIKEFAIESNPVKALKFYGEVMRDYARLCCSDKYCKMLQGYGDCFPLGNVADMGCCLIFILSWLILLGIISWTVGLVFVIIGPPISYIIGWFFIIFGLPVLYVITWICVLVGPPIGYVLAVAAGPFLSVRCPYVALRHNILRPGQLYISLYFGFTEPWIIFKKIDQMTAEISFNLRLFPDSGSDEGVTAGNQNWQKDVQNIQQVKYWELFLDRCRSKKNWLIENNWLTEDDVLSAAPNVMIAIPAIAILDVLQESLKLNPRDKSLIVWNDEVMCDDKTRNRADDVINVFWPRIMSVKTDMKYLIDKNAPTITIRHLEVAPKIDENGAPGVEIIELGHIQGSQVYHPDDREEVTYTPNESPAVERSNCCTSCFGPRELPINLQTCYLLNKEVHYMNAKICSGEDEQTQELKDALKLHTFGEEKTKTLNRVCANVTDIVLTLLRVREFTSGFSDVLQ